MEFLRRINKEYYNYQIFERNYVNMKRKDFYLIASIIMLLGMAVNYTLKDISGILFCGFLYLGAEIKLKK